MDIKIIKIIKMNKSSKCRFRRDCHEPPRQTGLGLAMTLGVRVILFGFILTLLNKPAWAGYSDSDATSGRFGAARDWTEPVSEVVDLENFQTGLPFTVNYEASDEISGIDSVTLYYRKGTSGAFTMFATDTFNGESEVSGSFNFDVLGLGDGRYEFATLATDVDGNSEAAPVTFGGFTTLDTVAPATTLTTTTGIVVDEKVINGNFSSGLSTGWNYTGEVTRILGSETVAGVTAAPPSGSGGMARVGQTEEDAGDLDSGRSVWDNRLTQVIDKQDGFLSFWWRVLSFDAGENPAAVVTINDREVLRVTGAEIDGGGYPNDSGWQRVFVDLSDFSDSKLELKFYSGNSDPFLAQQSWMYIDEVTTGRPAIRSTASVILTGADENGVKEVHYSLDNGASWEIKTGNNATISGTDLVAGVNLLKYFSVDNTGNSQAQPSEATQVIVDDQPPNPPEDFAVSGISEHEINVNWTAPADLGYFTRAAYYRITVNGTIVPNVKAPAAPGEAETFMIAGLTAGTEYQVQLFACDPVSNCSQAQPSSAATLTETDVDPGEVVINELMWMGMAGGAGDEWLELRNMTDLEFDLSGWQLTKKRTSDGVEVLMFTIPGGTTIAGRGYLLISEFDKANSGLNVDSNLVAGTGSDNSAYFALANSDLQIKLYEGDFTAGGLLIDTADDGSGTPAAGLTELGGSGVYYSMERNATPGDGTAAASWHTTLAETVEFFDGGLTGVKGTPGAENRSEGEIGEIREIRGEGGIRGEDVEGEEGQEGERQNVATASAMPEASPAAEAAR